MTKPKHTTSILLCGILLLMSYCNQQDVHQQINQRTTEIFDSLVVIRRDVHQNPELFFNEFRTSEIIANYLENLGLEVHRGIGGTGVVGILNTGREGRTIAWRADIDAIQSNFPDVVEFASVIEGIRHGCGHDVHMTIGLGIANVLTHIKDELSGKVVFIFQPAEETPAVRVYSGAQAMIDDGLYDIVKPDELYATHISDFAVGQVSIYPERVYAYLKPIIIRINEDIEPTSLKLKIDKELKKFNSHDIDLWSFLGDPKIGMFGDSTAFNDFVCSRIWDPTKEGSEYVIYGQLAGSDLEVLDKISEEIIDAIRPLIDFSNELKFEFGELYYNHYNNPGLSNNARRNIENIYGTDAIMRPHGLVPGSGDDFSILQQDIPGGYYPLGGSNFEAGIRSAPHSPDFAVDERSISYGVSFFSSLIVERLDND